MHLPTTQIIVYGQYDTEFAKGAGYGSGSFHDECEINTVEGAAAEVSEFLAAKNGTDYRVEHIARCHTTNRVESISDVTEDVAALVNTYAVAAE